MEWETVSAIKSPDYVGADATQRLRVEGGWLYRTVVVEERAHLQMEPMIAMCFVPDPAGVTPLASVATPTSSRAQV